MRRLVAPALGLALMACRVESESPSPVVLILADPGAAGRGSRSATTQAGAAGGPEVASPGGSLGQESERPGRRAAWEAMREQGDAQQSGISAEMYGVVCAARDAKVFSTTLTPNYNSDHRNHFHLDSGKSGLATGATTKLLPDGPSTPPGWPPTQVDEGDHADQCGWGA